MTGSIPTFGLFRVVHAGETVACADEKCSRIIYPEDEEHPGGMVCFIDATTGDIYCESCGLCVRYSRKKAAERKEWAAEAVTKKE